MQRKEATSLRSLEKKGKEVNEIEWERMGMKGSKRE